MPNYIGLTSMLSILGAGLIILVASLFAVPAVIQGATSSTSSSPGFLLVAISTCTLIGIFNRAKLLKLPYLSRQLKVILLALFITQSFRFILADPSSIDFQKIFFSFPLVAALLFCAQAFATLLYKIYHNLKLADFSTNYVFAFILLGICGLLGVRIPGLFLGFKQVVLFSEPSHYVIALTPLLVTSLVLSNRLNKVNIIQIACLLALSFLLQSVTLISVVVFSVLAHFAIHYKPAKVRFSLAWLVSAIILAIFSISIVFLVSQNQYFLQRLNFFNVDPADSSSVSSNISLLMGYQEAYLNLLRTDFLGLGFQQMGILDPTGVFADAVYTANADYTNRYDGSILASKIVSEFGLVGIFLIASYLLYCLKIIRASRANNVSAIQLFSIGLVLSPIPYLFIRGGGYFGGTVLIGLAGLLVLGCKEDQAH